MLGLLLTLPLLTALFIFSLETKKFRLAEKTVLLSSAASLVLFGKLLLEFVSGKTIVFGKYFLFDGLAAFVSMLIVVVGAIVSVYAIGYIRAEVEKKVIGLTRAKQFFVLMELFLFAMLLAANAANPILLWIAIEATTLATAFLISFYHKPSATEAAWKYLILNSLGLLLGLLGTLLFLAVPGERGGEALLTFDALQSLAGSFHPVAVKVAFIFILVGYGTKVGLAPMHTWLPDAHGKAPSPISALLSGVLLNVAFLAVLRFKNLTDAAVGTEYASNLLLFFGIFSLFISALIIFVQRSYKRLLAYSSIEHMGILALGFAWGGVGITAAFLHMLYHSLAKVFLFLAAGNILIRYSSTKFEKVSGVLRSLPVTGTLFFGGFLAISGIPPFGIFFSKFLILSSGMESHPWSVGAALLLLVIVFFGFFRHVSRLLFGPVPEGVGRGESNMFTLAPLFVLAVVFLCASFVLPEPIASVLEAAAQSVSLSK